MPAERIAMRQVRDVLRLNAAGVSGNEIARRVGVAPSTLRLTLKRLAVAGLSWPLPAELERIPVILQDIRRGGSSWRIPGNCSCRGVFRCVAIVPRWCARRLCAAAP